MRFRDALALITGRGDGPDVRRCPVCFEHYSKASGAPTSYSESTCSAECSEEYDRIWAI